jgi:hypothetical protein
LIEHEAEIQRLIVEEKMITLDVNLPHAGVAANVVQNMTGSIHNLEVKVIETRLGGAPKTKIVTQVDGEYTGITEGHRSLTDHLAM